MLFVIGTVGAAPRFVLGNHPAIAALNTREGEVCIPVDDVPPAPQMIVIGEDGEPCVITRSLALEEAREQRWMAAKLVRDTRMAAGCQSPLGPIDTGATSERRISSSASVATAAMQAGDAWSIDWTMRDNTVVTHDAPAMVAMLAALVDHTAACHRASMEIRARIDAAGSVEQVEAIDIEQGYPASP